MGDLDNSLIYDPSEIPTHESKELVGRSIVGVRQALDEELLTEGWEGKPRPMVLILDDGTKVYASCDPAGTAPGILFLLIPEDAGDVRIWHKAQVVPRMDEA